LTGPLGAGEARAVFLQAEHTFKEGEMLVPSERIERSILFIRGQKVMLDADLADLYGVATKVLNQAVKRNMDRFPGDFLFQLTAEEKAEVVTDCDHLAKLKFSPVLPYAFTEHGAIMAASVLNSPQAVEVSVFVVRAFVRLRELAGANREIMAKLEQLERRVVSHDKAIISLFDAIRQMMKSEEKGRKAIGFKVEEKGAAYA
jgi:hypothetical protein